MKITFLCVGKLKDINLRAISQDYLKRISHYAKVGCIEVNDSTPQQEGKQLLERSEGAYRIALSEEGRGYSSMAFAKVIDNIAKDFVFIIGGPGGLSDDVKSKSDLLLSLSSMTLPHELCRVLLAEQVYRAYTILNREPYHKQ